MLREALTSWYNLKWNCDAFQVSCTCCWRYIMGGYIHDFFFQKVCRAVKRSALFTQQPDLFYHCFHGALPGVTGMNVIINV